MGLILVNERELIGQARSGDRNALRQIVDTHKKAIFYLAYDLTGKVEDAEDLSQDVFLKAFRSLDRFKGDSSLGTWLYRIAVNTFLDQTRKRSYQYERNQLELTETVTSGSSGEDSSQMSQPEAFTDSSQLKEHIALALDGLTSRERSVFVLRHYQQFSVLQTADVLGVSEGTVKSLFSRAMKKMGESLKFYRQEGKCEVVK